MTANRICPICSRETAEAVCQLDGVPTVAHKALNRTDDDKIVGTSLADRYQVVRLIGRGGVGRVYEAIQTAFGRKVALKLIKREYASDLEQIRRFYLEARASSRLEHPSTIRVYDFGVTDDGVPFLAMELLEGETLKSRMRRQGGLSEREALQLTVPVVSALVEAHHAGIVHRDLKPENIFLKQVVGAGEVVKVCDFGIAKIFGTDDREQDALTGHGVIVGTPRYMAPEQVRSGQVGPWTDLYAVGTILFECLSGRPPFVADTPHKVLLAKVRNPAPRLAEVGPKGPISPALRVVVDALMVDDTNSRPRDTAEVALWLEALVHGRPDLIPVDELRARIDGGPMEVNLEAAPGTRASAAAARRALRSPQHTPTEIKVGSFPASSPTVVRRPHMPAAFSKPKYWLAPLAVVGLIGLAVSVLKAPPVSDLDAAPTVTPPEPVAIAPVLGLPPGTLTGVPNQPRGVIEVQGAIETDDYDDIEIIDLEQPDPAPVRTTGARVLDARVDALLRQGDAARDAGRLAEAQQRYLMASLVDPDRPGLDRRLAEVQAAIDRVRIDSTKKRTKKKKKRRRRPKRSKRSSGPYVIVD